MKLLTTALQSWSQKQINGNIKEQLALAQHILHHLEMAQDHRPLSADEDWLRCKLKQHYLTLVSLERTIVRLRSRVHHLKDEDANTAVFHKQVTLLENGPSVLAKGTNGTIGTGCNSSWYLWPSTDLVEGN